MNVAPSEWSARLIRRPTHTRHNVHSLAAGIYIYTCIRAREGNENARGERPVTNLSASLESLIVLDLSRAQPLFCGYRALCVS